MNATVALNNDENPGVPDVSGKHGPAVANSAEPPTHGNDHSIPADASEHGNAPSHSHGNPGSEMNPTVALNNDENPGVPDVSGKHGPAVANSAEPPTHGNDHSIPADASEHGNAPSHSGNPGSDMNPTVALNNDENLGVPEDSGKYGPAVASPVANSGEPPTHGNDHSIPGDVTEHDTTPSPGAPPSTAHGISGSAGPGDSFKFSDAIVGSESSGVIELAGLDHTPASTGQHANAAGNGEREEAQTIELSLPGQSADHVSGYAGNAVVTQAPHDLIV